MSNQNQLSIARLIAVTVNLSPAAAQAQNLSTLLVLGSSNVIDVVSRLRAYTSLTAVATDFGTNAPEYLAAVLYFGQVPQPSQLLIGRWAQTATSGQLFGATLTAAQQTALLAVTDGGFSYSINGSAHSAVSLNFSTQTNMNAVAAIIQAALTGATCVWDAVNSRFVISSNTSGATSTVSFLTAPPTGGYQNISTLLAMTASSSGAFVAPGIVAESALAAATLFDAQFGQQWYALTIPQAVDSDHLAIAPFIQGTTNKHIYGVSTIEAGVLVPSYNTDIASELQALNVNRTLSQFSSTNSYVASSLLGRAITTDWNGNNTAITLFYKNEPDVTAENLTETQAESIEGKNCNAFMAYNNGALIVEPGVMASGDYIDIITGTDWLAVTIQTAVFNLLYGANKIPQTDAGNHQIVTTIEAVLSQGVANGLLAPGVWTNSGFGSLNQGDFLSKGFYVYAPPIATQDSADRAKRKSVTFQIAAKLAGAIQTVDIQINVNR